MWLKALNSSVICEVTGKERTMSKERVMPKERVIPKENRVTTSIKGVRLYFLFLLILSVSAILFVKNDYFLYKEPIGKVISITEAKGSPQTDISGNTEASTRQYITVQLMNGPSKGERLQLTNEYTYTGAFDTKVLPAQELFLHFTTNENGVREVSIGEYKRDLHLTYILLLFIGFMLLIGRRKGITSLLSIILNILLLILAIALYGRGIPILLIATSLMVLYIFFSMVLLCGWNRKSWIAGLSTFASTGVAVLLALLTYRLLGGSGVHFEVMEFNVGNFEQIYLAQIMIGTLGGAMDISVTIVSAVSEMLRVNPSSPLSTIRSSAGVIGNDIMGSMANTLVMAYLSGAFPTGVLLLCNNVTLPDFISFYLNLELIRALVGSIAIVLSIPFAIELSARILKWHPLKEEVSE